MSITMRPAVLVLLGITLLLPACNDDPGSQPTRSQASEEVSAMDDSTISPRSFVTVEGTRFKIGERAHAFCGVNFWAAMNLAVDGEGGDRQRLLAELDHLQQLGVSNMRVMAASEGPESEPYRLVPAMLISPGHYNQKLLEGLDYLLAECGKRNLYLVMVLNNFWEWSGGMAQYVSWDDGSEIPYAPTHGWPAFVSYSARFYECRQCQQWYRSHIRTLIERVNSITGISYRDDPTIFAWELANEPRHYPMAWIDETAAFIKSLDSNHLVTTGSEGEVGGPFVDTHRSEHIDYATLHIWPQNWEWFKPEEPATFDTAEEKALAYLISHVEQALALGKPLVLEEFGLARDWSPEADIHDPAAPTTLRDRFFKTMLDEVTASAQSGGPLAGDAIWSWSGQGRPGDRWTGDPPHETPGWYSVYDQDASTLAILAEHAAALQGIDSREP
jgi:mannan endo-1,4-beta-mannosidase